MTIRRTTIFHTGIFFLLCVLVCFCSKADDSGFTVVRVDTASEDLRIFWQDDTGHPFRSFDRLASWLTTQHKKLVFGMNAGMYHPDASACGLLVIDGKQVAPLNQHSGHGNFYIKPNGVFLISPRGPRVVDTVDYPQLSKDISYATQSGPMLLKNGVINSAFKATSTSRLIRNGVCASGSVAMFVIAEKPVNFYEFAAFFRDELHCRDALYLDGSISSLYSPARNRDDFWAPLGPILGVVQ